MYKVLYLISTFLFVLFLAGCSIDLQKPVITLNGDATITVEVHNEILDPMATATDKQDDEVTVESDFDQVVNFDVVGDYTVTYTAIDNAKNKATATRLIKVVDTTIPTIVLGDEVTVEVGTAYDKVMATVSDNYDDASVLSIQDNWDNTVDLTKLGEYTVTYTATDSSGNEAKKDLKVKVVDTTDPVMTLIDENYSVNQYEQATDPGVNVTDNYDQNVTVTSDFDTVVDTSKFGTYTVRYFAQDSSGNRSVKYRTVTVNFVAPTSCGVDTMGPYQVSIINSLNDESTLCGGYDTFSDAKSYIQNYNGNGYISYNNKIVYAKEALIRLVKTTTGTSLTNFYTTASGAMANGGGAFSYFSSEYKGTVYANDAIYLGTESNNGKFAYKILLNGAIGWINSNDALIILPSDVDGVSYYKSDGTSICHAISLSVETERWTSCIALDVAPSFMVKNTLYYSFDGHYFYTDWQDIAKDVNNNSHALAVNQVPYYNYYQYLPLRSRTNYTTSELNAYLDSILPSTSVLKNQAQEFIDFQNTFNMNGALELSFANHESGLGTSALARDKNNLFGMNATDSNPYGNGYDFPTLQDGIFYHGDYFLTKGYINPSSFRYNGGVLGNKYEGMNVKYASDIYWGEKIAGQYYRLDKALGLKDHGTYTVGFSNQKVDVLANDLTTTLYSLEGNSGHDNTLGQPMIILGESGDYYKVQLDAPLVDGLINTASNYDAQASIGYVLKTELNVY